MCILLLYLTYGYNRLSKDTFRASLAMFPKPARQHALPRISNETELINYMGRKQAAETAETHYITAESQVPTLRVGSVVSLYSSFLERVGNISKESLGNFIITEITHEVSQGSYYKNRFKAIPGTVMSLPNPKVEMPLAETQMATVLSNADPHGAGRVQVRMNWQTDNMRTSWVRVMTPDGGGSKDVKSNRGFVFIPEVGDQVLLGFRHGDPARPYVMGSLFNGTTGGGGGQGNNCKSLTSRTGCALKLDDSVGSVTLSDPGKTSIHMDGAGNATFDSSDKILISCGSATIELHKDGTIKINGKDISVDGKNIKVDGADSIKQTTKQYETTGTQSVKIKSKALVEQKAQKIKIEAGNTVSIKGTVAADIESVTTNVKGSGSINLN